MDRRPIRVALIGYGLAGAVFHAPLIAATDGLELSAIVTSNEQRRREAKVAFPEAELLGSADDLWRQAERFDLAVVASPNITHVPLALASFEAGLGVVVDKPMAASSADALALIERAERDEMFFSVFQNRRWDGDFLTLRRLIDEDRLGRVHRFESRFERWRPELSGAWRETGDPAAAGGLLFDLGSHLIDQALQLFGPVTNVYAELDRVRAGAATDDDSFVALAHASGVRSQLWMSLVVAEPGPRLRAIGSKGSFVKNGLDGQEAALERGVRPGMSEWGMEPAANQAMLFDDVQAWSIEIERGRYEQFYGIVAQSIISGTPPPVDPRDSLAGLRVIEAAQRSAAERTVVELDGAID